MNTVQAAAYNQEGQKIALNKKIAFIKVPE